MLCNYLRSWASSNFSVSFKTFEHFAHFFSYNRVEHSQYIEIDAEACQKNVCKKIVYKVAQIINVIGNTYGQI